MASCYIGSIYSRTHLWNIRQCDCMEQLLLPVRKAEAGRSMLSVTEPIAKWFGFPEGDSVTSASLALSIHNFLFIRSLFMAFNVLFRYCDHLLSGPLFQFSHLKLVYYVDWGWSRVQQHTTAEGEANFFVSLVFPSISVLPYHRPK